MDIERQGNIVFMFNKIDVLRIVGGDALRPGVGIITALRGGKAPGAGCSGDSDVAAGVGDLAEYASFPVLASDRSS